MRKLANLLMNSLMMLGAIPLIVGAWFFVATMATLILALIILMPFGLIVSLFPSYFSVGASQALLIIAGILYASIVSMSYLYCAYRAIKSIVKFYKRNIKYSNESKSVQKKADFQFDNERLAIPLEQLPTAKNLQDLILADGEIPDEAFQKKNPHQG